MVATGVTVQSGSSGAGRFRRWRRNWRCGVARSGG